MTDKVKYGLAIGGTLALVLGILWYQASSASAALQQARQEAAAAQARNDQIISQLKAQNDDIARQNNQLASANAALQGQIAGLQQSVLALRQQTIERVAEVAKLPPTARATQTAALIAVPETEITVQPTGLLLSDIASQRNLETLITGDSAKKELELSRQNIALLEKQRDNLQAINDGLEKTIANKDIEIAAVKDTSAKQIAALQAEVKDVKAKARKRNAIVALLSFAGGLIVKGML